MRIQPKVYTSKEEKRRDLWTGIAIFAVVNLVLLLIYGSTGLVNTDVGTWPAWLINLAVLVFFLFTRRWIALGVLAAIAFLIALSLLAMFVVLVICFPMAH